MSEYLWEEQKEYPELNPLRTGSIAKEFEVHLNKSKVAAGRNPDLERELKQILEADQRPRLLMDTVGRHYGFNSPQAKPVWDEMRRVDSMNLPKVEQILQLFGYPGKRLVGNKLSSTAWLIIQHSSLSVQEKYLPLIQQAAEQGELDKSNLALLIDRLRLKKGQKQLYGTQVHNGPDGRPSGFEPIEDESNVNKRRTEMGLPPLEEYARHWGFEYVVPEK
ncbi:DUF6624 domain-containing protein [Salmonirosea aquatica]|uniref:Uncharacterized protein n=1 Tax=Salmonirosea aquatica TaxID=2654236 RepID=A0A7C9BBR5_9BACT|nr:hypothetical protein [Cytophagaceae bacterium SJW1-29]